MFRKFNIQNTTHTDPLAQANWQTIQDNTKSNLYVPTYTVTSSAGSITSDGQFSFHGPWVMVRFYLAVAGGTFDGPAGSATISLPTMVLTPVATHQQYLVVFTSVGYSVGSSLSNSGNVGQVTIPHGIFNTSTFITSTGLYLRD